MLILMTACQSKGTLADTTETTSETTAETAAKTVAHTEKTTVQGVKVGDKAPDFELKNVDGQLYSFANITAADGAPAKGYIVTFTCNTCPYAVAYEDRLIALHHKLAPMGYPVVAIQPNDPEVKEGDSFEAMQARHQEKGFPFLYLLDEGQKIYPQYGASRTPEVYLVDANRIVRYHGAIDDNAQDAEAVTVNYVEKAVEAIEAGRDPDPADVKAIGCTIKTKKM
ncbi:MAG: thioredoxin family protein [Bacteroidetes bacterium]|nr:MAG: thioredoxin family protein [Bacteroidota bacterium]